MRADSGTLVTVRGMPVDEILVCRARECGDALLHRTGLPCRVGMQAIRRLGSEPEVEVTVSLELHGAPVWATASHPDWSAALAAAFRRVGDRVAAALHWGSSGEFTWQHQEATERAS